MLGRRTAISARSLRRVSKWMVVAVRRKSDALPKEGAVIITAPRHSVRQSAEGRHDRYRPRPRGRRGVRRELVRRSVTGGAGGNVAAAAGWERATLELTEGISLLRGLSHGRLGHFVKGKRTWTRAFESASGALRGINCCFVRSTRGSHRWPSGRCSRRSRRSRSRASVSTCHARGRSRFRCTSSLRSTGRQTVSLSCRVTNSQTSRTLLSAASDRRRSRTATAPISASSRAPTGS